MIVVGINSRQHLLPSLRSLADTEWGGYSHEIIYVDNASCDDSVDTLRREFPEVRIIVNQENKGFCRACNQGAATTDSRYLYLLNNDTLLFPASIPVLIEFLDKTEQAGAAANRLLNPDLTDQWSARRFPTWSNALLGRRTLFGKLFSKSKPVRDYLFKDSFLKNAPFRVDWVPGSCTLVRREAFRTARLFIVSTPIGEFRGSNPHHKQVWNLEQFKALLEKHFDAAYFFQTGEAVEDRTVRPVRFVIAVCKPKAAPMVE